MPITKSAKKSLKVSETKRAQNRLQKIALSKALKKADATNVSEVISVIDKSAKKNIIHKNKAARMKSKLAKKFETAKTAKTKVQGEKSVKSEPKKATAKKTASKAKAK